MGEMCVQNLVRKREGKKPLGRTSRRFVDRNKNYYKGIGWDSVDWIHLVVLGD
jgi:hypothetical protein